MIRNAQVDDEGDYTALVSNAVGHAFSRPSRLYVGPMIALPLRRYTNESGRQLLYTYAVPQNYNPGLRYQIFLEMAGAELNESNYRTTYRASRSFVGAANEALTLYERSDHRRHALVHSLGNDFLSDSEVRPSYRAIWRLDREGLVIRLESE